MVVAEISKISASSLTVVWCRGHGCHFPTTQLRFELTRSAEVRLVLDDRHNGRWRQVAMTTLDGHAGANRRGVPPAAGTDG